MREVQYTIQYLKLKSKFTVSTRNSILDTRNCRESSIDNRGTVAVLTYKIHLLRCYHRDVNKEVTVSSKKKWTITIQIKQKSISKQQ